MATIRRIRSMDECKIGDMTFIYRPGIIDVYFRGVGHVDEIKFPSDEVTTTQHFEEKCMWWAHEYNQI